MDTNFNFIVLSSMGRGLKHNNKSSLFKMLLSKNSWSINLLFLLQVNALLYDVYG